MKTGSMSDSGGPVMTSVMFFIQIVAVIFVGGIIFLIKLIQWTLILFVSVFSALNKLS